MQSPGSELFPYQTMDRGDGVRLAFAHQAGRGPTLVWLSGFNSDMGGTKAEALAGWAAEKKRAFLRLDYSGCGRSEGRFEDGTISIWRDDALAVVDAKSKGDLVLVGSSMGGWLALLIALARPERVKGLILIAPAPDFTEGVLDEIPEEGRRAVLETGRWDMPSPYDPQPTPITRSLIEDGRRNLLLSAPIPFQGPVHILQGVEDAEVPWRTAIKLMQALESCNTALTLVKDGDHRLSRPQDLARLLDVTERFLSAL